MCCVVGYVGRSVSRDRILEGLARLEYRGYDSAGCAFLEPQRGAIASYKVVGGVDKLRSEVVNAAYDGTVGIGHTRWSTHGAVTWENAHPLLDCTGSVAVVHNGIIENERTVRQELAAAGHTFRSQTDSELIAHCFEDALSRGITEPQKILRDVVGRMQGAYAFVAMSDRFPDMLFIARHRSPLCLGLRADGIFVASDPLAFAGEATHVIFIPDAAYACVTPHDYKCWSIVSGEKLTLQQEPLTLTWQDGGKQGYEHYMLKEIYEQREVVHAIVRHARAEAALVSDTHREMVVQSPGSLLLIGCGTSLHAAHLGRWYYEALVQLPARVVMASEMRERPLFADMMSTAIALSQSGETADTLEALRGLHAVSIPVVAITNVTSSTLAREAEEIIPMHAGVEVAVASTKAFTAQVAILYLLAHEYAIMRGLRSSSSRTHACDNLAHAADCLNEAIARHTDRIDRILAPRYAQKRHALFIGREMSYVIAQESALKLKELAYVFAEAYAAGELKHGPLALIDSEVPVFVCSVLEPVAYRKLVGNVQEIKSRRGHLVIVAFEGQDELIALADEALVIPAPRDHMLGPLAMIGVLQYLVYRWAHELKLPIDKPRNLAKSVTVE